MSTYSNEQDRRDTELLSRYRISAPSPELRDRVLRAASDAWNTPEPASAEVPWRVPLFRLAASLVLTLTLVNLANNVEKRSRAPWQPTNQSAALTRPHTEAWTLVGVNPFALLAASVAEKTQSQSLRDHIQRIQELLSTSEGCEMKRMGPS